MGVKIGDVVSGVLFERGKVVGVGTAEELLMYDEPGALQEMLTNFGDGTPVACIAVEFQDRRTAVYVASEVYPLRQKFFNVSVTRMVEDEYLGIEAADHDDALRKALLLASGTIADSRVQRDKLDEKYIGAHVSLDGDLLVSDAPSFEYTLDDEGEILCKEEDE
jgi:hypothetical protein